MAKPNYAFEKRQRELAKKKKKEEKQRERRTDTGVGSAEDGSPEASAVPGETSGAVPAGGTTPGQ